ncbi:MAG: prepilin peptidase [Lachnospiraceae bacterium]|nr:prepilin peptidase [Lachnospiraceae bacterium]
MGIVIIGIIMASLSLVAFPLADFIKKVEDGKCCKQCDCVQSCFAKKCFLFGKYTWLDEFMLITFLKIHSHCLVDRRWKKKEMLSYFIVGLFLMMILFWSGEHNLTTALYVVCTGALLMLTVVDWKTEYIPFECDVLIFICGLIRLFVDFSNWLEYVIGLLTVSGFLFLVNACFAPLLKRKYAKENVEIDSVMGDGDIKLMAATGLLLGWKLNLLALMLGCIIGSIIHIVLMAIKKGERQFALGPYLSVGIYISMVCGEQLISWYLSMIGVMPL